MRKIMITLLTLTAAAIPASAETTERQKHPSFVMASDTRCVPLTYTTPSQSQVLGQVCTLLLRNRRDNCFWVMQVWNGLESLTPYMFRGKHVCAEPPAGVEP